MTIIIDLSEDIGGWSKSAIKKFVFYHSKKIVDDEAGTHLIFVREMYHMFLDDVHEDRLIIRGILVFTASFNGPVVDALTSVILKSIQIAVCILGRKKSEG